MMEYMTQCLIVNIADYRLDVQPQPEGPINIAAEEGWKLRETIVTTIGNGELMFTFVMEREVKAEKV